MPSCRIERLKQLAAQAGMGLRSLQETRARLPAAGWLVVRARQDVRGGQAANAYDFAPLFARLEEAIAADPPADNAIAAASDPHPGPEEADQSFLARFGGVVAAVGVAAVPQALFTYQGALHLT